MSRRSLLDLPPEIRNQIYRLVLVQVVSFKPNVRRLFSIAEEHEKTLEPYDTETTVSLARTCRQIHDEAIAVYYGGNSFEFENTYDLYVFLYMISWERRRCIEAISFFYQGVCPREAFELLSDCTRLRQLDITISHETTKGARQPQRDIWKANGMLALRRVRGSVNLNLSIQEVKDVHYRGYRGSQPYQKHFSDHHVEEVAAILKSELTSNTSEEIDVART